MTEMMKEFSTGATRSAEGDKLNYEGFLSPLVLERYAQYMHKHRFQANGKLRDADNWQRGMARNRYVESLVRHVMDFWRVWRTAKDAQAGMDYCQDLLCAVLFNAMGLLHEILIRRDVKD